jgi:N-acetylglucosamine-6-phosphate deacetylase
VRRGAWHEPHLRLPDTGELSRLIEAGGGTLRRINIAPELPGAMGMIRAAVRAGLVVSIGHSDATQDVARAAAGAGATIVNHTFNAMSGLHHRAPGLVGEAMTNDGLLAELILDGVHVHPAAAQALYRARGPHGIALITDGVAWAGLPDGAYERSGRPVIVADGVARLADGTIAGSISPFDRSVLRAREWLTGDLEELAALTSGNAARVMGIADRVGTIAPGFDADLVLLDEAFHVIATVVKGEVVYRRDGVR